MGWWANLDRKIMEFCECINDQANGTNIFFLGGGFDFTVIPRDISAPADNLHPKIRL